MTHRGSEEKAALAAVDTPGNTDQIEREVKEAFHHCRTCLHADEHLDIEPCVHCALVAPDKDSKIEFTKWEPRS